MVTTPTITNLIEKSFSKSASTYDLSADIQQQAALSLAALIDRESHTNIIPPGPILEIGSGTGLFSQELLKLFPDREITFIDLSESMLSCCQRKLSKFRDYYSSNCNFIQADGESYFVSPHGNKQYALIAASFTFQWYRNLDESLIHALNVLMPGGKLCFSVPSTASFPEWKKICQEGNLPFTGNSLPSSSVFQQIAEKTRLSLHLEHFQLRQDFTKSLQFFQSLRNIGAAIKIPAETDVNINSRGQSTRANLWNSSKYPGATLRRLVKHWDSRVNSQVSITYEVTQGVYTKTLSDA